jgi:pimeloyl-ACP methyl ester carboxylesterase
VNSNAWIWHISFFHVPDFPEMLITGKEKLFWETWMKNETYDPTAITEEDVNEWARTSAAPGGLRAIFEVYRATFKNIEDDKKWAEQKLTMPVLAVGSQYFIGEENRRQMERVAENVHYVELDCGHSMALERPEKLARTLHDFFQE